MKMRLRHHCSSLSILAVPAWLAATVAWAGGAPADRIAPRLGPTQVNVTQDETHRYGEPEIAVNPKNPDNLVYYIMSNRLTYRCEAAGDKNCTTFTHGSSDGEYNVPGWISTDVFVSFDRGRTWKKVDFPSTPAFRDFPGEASSHSDLVSRGDPMVTVTANGTFYIGWDSMHLGFQNIPGHGVVGSLIDGGIAVSKSTDGGRTWSTPVLTGTGVDRPWLTTDLATGTIYEASSGFVHGSMSTGNPKLPIFSSPADRWVVSSRDGVHWTAPRELGGGGFAGPARATISAAQGVLAAAFQATSAGACKYFVSSAPPCTVFETSTDSGAHWTRHAVPGLSNATGDILVAADPVRRGNYTVAALDSTETRFRVFFTSDSGATWKGPAIVTDNPHTIKFKPWIDYSPEGVLGLAWRSVTTATTAATSAQRSAAAGAVSHVAYLVPPSYSAGCGMLGCGLPEDLNDVDPPSVPYAVWAAISTDCGVTFSDPLRVSSAPSPAADPKMLMGTDDTSVITVGRHDVFVGWGDWRPGNVAGYFSAVRLTAFSHAADGANREGTGQRTRR